MQAIISKYIDLAYTYVFLSSLLLYALDLKWNFYALLLNQNQHIFIYIIKMLIFQFMNERKFIFYE